MKQSRFSGKSVSLVLGAGGARGLAHIGVIRALENAGLEIEAIAGSSMGALVGGIHAAGRLQTYEDWICELKQSNVLSLIDWSFSGDGLIKGQRIIDRMAELVGEYEIESLPIDFTAVAVDLNQGRELWLDRGSLFDAVRASIAIPGLFTPHHYRGRTLVDGGILNPVPVAPTLRHATDMTIVVDVNGPAAEPPPLESDEEAGEDDDGMLARMREFINGWRSSNREAEETRPGMMAMMLKSVDTMQAALTRQHLAIFRPDLMISIPKNAAMIHEFHRARDIIDLGEELAREALDNPRPVSGRPIRTREFQENRNNGE